MTPERVERLRSVLNRRQPDLSVITDYVHKGRNLSAIVRNCDAAGVMRVHAVVPRDEYRAFRGTAKGSHRWVDVERHDDLGSVLEQHKTDGFQIVAAQLSDQAVDYRSIDYTRPTALLMGAEKTGVSDTGCALADHHVTIPMVGMVESFNVSVAVGIILAEAHAQRHAAGLYAQRRIADDDYERLFFEWGHPKISHFCRSNGLAYPPLREDGEIDNPSAWYAQVRRLKADGIT